MDKDKHPEQRLPEEGERSTPVIAPTRDERGLHDEDDHDDASTFHYRDWASI